MRERFEANLDLVDILARQVGRRFGEFVELDDLVSYGREGLLDASRRFDASRGVPFRAYANFRVRGAIIDGVRTMARVPRRVHERLGALAALARVSEGAVEDLQVAPPPGAQAVDAERALTDHLRSMATAMAMGLLAPTARDDDGEPIPVVDAETTPEEAMGKAELMQLVTEAIEELPAQEAELVKRHYLQGDRFDLVAQELGLSKSWASRLHTRALGRLSKRLRGLT
ncbi:MAG TPA: sigma-70 family RNA polymerase sigma factor [Polyangiaceae bacterium]